jgi:hypothetical protein
MLLKHNENVESWTILDHLRFVQELAEMYGKGKFHS